MSDEFAEASLDANVEVFEEDYIIEEIDDSGCALDIKQEHSPQPTYLFTEEHAHIVYLGKNDTSGEHDYHCALCNVTFDATDGQLREKHYHFKTEVEQYDDDNLQTPCKEDEGELNVLESQAQEDSETIEFQTDNIKIEAQDIVCQHCEYVFESMLDVESHQCNETDLDTTIICKYCHALFSTNADKETHECHAINETEENITSLFSCPQCPKKFPLIDMLQQHQKCHRLKKEQSKKIKDPGGNKKFESPASGQTHCSICNTTFSSSKNLKLHAKMHQKIPMKTIRDAMPIGADNLGNKDQFFCEICNKSFDHALLSVHQNMHQNVEEHNCSICNRQFENQISYDMHVQLHNDQPTRVRTQQVAKPGARFACNYCGREFLRPHEKVKHERIHTGEKPHECEVCGKSFRVSYSLTLHLRTHTDVRPFVCAQCNKRFKAYAVYSHHLNTHSEDRPYKCTMCPKSFRTSVQLCGHKNSHTKPYSCPECNRPFGSLYAVKMHMKTHNKANKSNDNLKHRCGVCGAVYARMFALRFHMKEQHSEDLTEDQIKNFDKDKKSPITADDCFNEDEVSTQAIIQGEEIIIDNFQTEEIVTDWLSNT